MESRQNSRMSHCAIQGRAFERAPRRCAARLRASGLAAWQGIRKARRSNRDERRARAGACADVREQFFRPWVSDRVAPKFILGLVKSAVNWVAPRRLPECKREFFGSPQHVPTNFQKTAPGDAENSPFSRHLPGWGRHMKCKALPVEELRCGRFGTNRSSQLKALAAKYGTALSRLEGNGCFLAALRTNGFGLDSLRADRARTIAVALCAAALARLTAFGLVLEAFVREEHLLAGREDKLCSAVSALQNFIVIFHVLLRDPAGRGRQLCRANQRRTEAARVNLGFRSPYGSILLCMGQAVQSPNPAHAVAFYGDVYARGPALRDAFLRASCSNCAFLFP